MWDIVLGFLWRLVKQLHYIILGGRGCDYCLVVSFKIGMFSCLKIGMGVDRSYRECHPSHLFWDWNVHCFLLHKFGLI